MECEEVGCSRPATRTWGGRSICQDHYEHHQELHERRIMDLNDAYD